MATSSQPTLQTERLTLRPFAIGDARDVQRLAGQREVAETTLNIPHPYPDGAAEGWITHHPEAWGAGTGATFAIADRSSGELLGAVGLMIAAEHSRAELGYWVGVDHWNRGYCTEAARAVVRFAFETLALNRVQARHLTRNPASGRVMEKLGMQYEGVNRKAMKKWDQFEDIAMYAILASDFSG